MSRIGLVGENSVEYFISLLEIWKNRDSAVLLDINLPPEKLASYLVITQASRCIMDEKAANRFKHYLTDSCPKIVVTVYKTDIILPSLFPKDKYKTLHTNYSENEALVVFSSGTTGSTKGISISFRAIHKNSDAIAGYMDLKPTDCLYMAKSNIHLSTITGEFLTSIKSGCSLIIGKTLSTPRLMIESINKFHVTKVCLNPYLLSLIVNEVSCGNPLGTTLSEIYVYGAAATSQLLLKAECLGIPIFCEYGLSEAGPRVSSQKIGYHSRLSAGMPLPEVSIRILGEQSKQLLPGTVGAIFIKTPGLFSGYVCGQKHYQMFYKDYFNTGDLGYITEGGELFITGRQDNVINLFGHKIVPEDLEKIICEVFPITECCVSPVTIGDQTVLGCLYVGDNDYSKIEFIHLLRSKLLPYEIPGLFFRIRALPRNENGKVARLECAAIVRRKMK